MYMADWSDQITGFQRTCMEQQQQLLSGWFGVLQSAGTNTPQHVWNEAIDALEKQVNGALDTQQLSFHALLNTVEQADNSSLEIKQWEHKAAAGIGLWTDMQHQLWKTWFDMLRKASPAKKDPGEMLTQNWQDMVQQTMEMQQLWLSTWTGGQSESYEPSTKRTKKPPT
jgi:hypothetical protein